MIPQVLLLAVIFTLIGVLFGIITGLIPGIHVNTVAIVLMVSAPISLGFASEISSFLGVPSEYAVHLISCLIVANLITHTFLDFIPSALFGAPDEDTALSVLPAHRMVLEGRGMEAIRLSAGGSIRAVLIAMALLFPAFLFFGPLGAYGFLKPYTAFILIAIVSVLIAGEYRKGARYPLYALIIFIFSGMFGWVVLNGNLFGNAPLVSEPMRESAPLFSGLTGLFGIAALIQSLGVAGLEPGKESRSSPGRSMLKSSFIGTLAGALVGWFPGVTSASATVLASDISGDTDGEDFIVSMSAVNTSNAFFVILALFVIGKARSGALGVVKDLAMPDIWSSTSSPPSFMFLLLFSAVVAGAFAYPLTLLFGSFFLKRMRKLDYSRLNSMILLFVLILVLVLAGPLGLFIASIAAMLGLIPPLIGISRVHLMGFLILPTIVYFI